MVTLALGLRLSLRTERLLKYYLILTATVLIFILRKWKVNRNYVKGRTKEYKIVEQHRKQGFASQRFAGSHSLFDVFSINPKLKIIVLTQSKAPMPSKADRKKYTEIKKQYESNHYKLIVELV
jgi:hypothetical protein